jgi:hypothetical protein
LPSNNNDLKAACTRAALFISGNKKTRIMSTCQKQSRGANAYLCT